MTDIDKLKEEELNKLKKVEVQAEEVNIEDLIVLGEVKKIPIHITYFNQDGSQTKTKALIKQLTVKEMENLNVTQKNLVKSSITILQKAFFKTTGEPFSKEELSYLPVGVANAVSKKILEISGMDNTLMLQDF